MHDALFNMKVSEGSAELDEDAPDSLLFDTMAFFRLREDVITKRVSVKELHDDVNVA